MPKLSNEVLDKYNEFMSRVGSATTKDEKKAILQEADNFLIENGVNVRDDDEYLDVVKQGMNRLQSNSKKSNVVQIDFSGNAPLQ